MAETTKPSLHTLPVEVLYRIMNHLDDFNILCSMRNVCIRINTIMDNYRRYKKLTTLQLCNNKIDLQKIIHVANTLQQSKTITTLDMGVNQIDDQGVQYIADALQQNQTLTKLCLHINKIGPQGAKYLANALQHNQTLTGFNLHLNQIGDEGTEYIANALQQNKTLTKLNLIRNQIGDKGAYHLANTLQQNQTLTTLYIAENQIGNEGAQYLANALQQNKTLITFYIAQNHIGDEGAKYFANALQQNQTLVTLSLKRNEIGDEGAYHLANALSQNKTLASLNLKWNQIGDEGANHLAKALQQNKSDIEISDWGKQFQPANLIELLTSFYTTSLFGCTEKCNINVFCRTFDYDSSTFICRLFEGAVSTGSIIPSVLTSRIGALHFSPEFFAAYGQPCNHCEQHRYLICSNESCCCPSHSFWNGIQCENQRYIGAPCNQLDSCRSDILGLQCTSYNICLNSTNPPPIIEWSFNGNLNDMYGIYNGISVNGTVQWASPGYSGYGMVAYFTDKTYSLVPHSLKLIDTSFTISTWIMLLSSAPLNSSEFGLFTHCENKTIGKCLYFTVRYGKLLASLYISNISGNTYLTSYIWYHVAYVYDHVASTQSIYLNGQLDGILSSSDTFQSNASQMWIGASPYIDNYPNPSACMEKMIIVPHTKSSSELLDEGTLVVYYKFDNSFVDSGPNKVQNGSGINTQFDANGRVNQALLINSNYSFFQTSGFYFLGRWNYPYTFSLWLYPFTTNGTIIQLVAPDTNWWSPMLGFDYNNRLVAQTWDGLGFYHVASESFSVPLNTWTHVATTFSTTNGLRLFINGTFINVTSSGFTHGASGSWNTMTVGACFGSTTWCNNTETQIVPNQYRGKIDEMKIYSRELTMVEIQTLINI